jgi:hypothetical protein
MSVNVNSDNRVFDVMVALKVHMRKCRMCQGAVKTRDYELLCKWAKANILEAVIQFDTVIPRRLSAARKRQRVFYACPDLAKHSKAYAMTAEPLIAVGVQEGLF